MIMTPGAGPSDARPPRPRVHRVLAAPESVINDDTVPTGGPAVWH